MEILLNTINLDLLQKSIAFVLAGLLGMIYAYYRKWSFDAIQSPFFVYILGDGHATGRALTTLGAMCAGAGGLDYLTPLTLSQIIIAGAGIGLLVPQTVENKKEKTSG